MIYLLFPHKRGKQNQYPKAQVQIFLAIRPETCVSKPHHESSGKKFWLVSPRLTAQHLFSLPTSKCLPSLNLLKKTNESKAKGIKESFQNVKK